MVTHAGHCYYQSSYTSPEIFSRIVPRSKSLFDPSYPDYPKTNREKLRKVRMDAELQIKEFAKLVGVDDMTMREIIKCKTRKLRRAYNLGKEGLKNQLQLMKTTLYFLNESVQLVLTTYIPGDMFLKIQLTEEMLFLLYQNIGRYVIAIISIVLEMCYFPYRLYKYFSRMWVNYGR